MNVVDLHPEELLDRDARGALTPEERARLEIHLARCETCRFERDARQDFALETAEFDEELALSAGRLALLVDAGVREQTVAVGPAHPERASNDEHSDARVGGTNSARRRVVRGLIVAAAAVLLVGGAAGASELGFTHRLRHWLPLFDGGRGAQTGAAVVAVAVSVTQPPPPTSHYTPAAPANADGALHGHPGDVGAVTRVMAETSPPSQAIVMDDWSALPEPSVRPSVGSSVGSRVERVRRVAEAPEERVTRGGVPLETHAASELFEAASAARRQGDHARALALDAELQARFPTSREAHVSYAASGRLLLDRGDAAAALANFDKYRARGPGELDETVMAGRAMALERLGRTEEARGAWRTLLDTFAHSPYAAHARARLETTGR